jgi:hypothetical protein
MFCHEVHEFFIAQVSSCDVLLIRRFLGADYLMRPQSGTMQELAEFLLVERFTDVVHTLKFHAFSVKSLLTSRQVLQVGFSYSVTLLLMGAMGCFLLIS